MFSSYMITTRSNSVQTVGKKALLNMARFNYQLNFFPVTDLS